ncbi:oxidoreductase [Nadsonia fulvescens var. elongata DSM 6958]|uniref:Oxidoreductase n=1 Tax=Nadsonia fulvescens var. elongata DSM 6958 TaxID=857566 RepID=A0A1E3PSS6_9ASCO|nr:oxidoreductase [Nadsonia fulvescens var. elongata DSM 6958]
MVARLQGKNCIITGAAGGIGLETAIQFAKEGANVLMSDVNANTLRMALEQLKSRAAKGVRIETNVCDVSKEDQVKAMVDHVESWGGVDVIFNNAGIMHPKDDGVLNTPENIWDLTQDINVKGVYYGCKHAIKSMLSNKKKSASVINTGSFVALMGAATPQIAYTTSKGAVLAMSRELAICYAKQGIRVNSLCPGPLNTPLLQEFLDTEEKALRRTIHLPSGRFGEAIEQAKAVVFLASDDSSYVNGQDFLVDGGLTKSYVTSLGTPPKGPENEVFGKAKL